MGAKIQAFDIFQTPLSSHYPLPLSVSGGNLVVAEYIFVSKTELILIKKITKLNMR
jgi:hypothetical protein